MTTVIQFPERDARTLTERVSEEVKALMGRYGVNQTQLATWLGINQTAVSARLRGATAWHITSQAVTAAVGRQMRLHGISGSLHRARHTYATTLLRGGTNVRVVQSLMRHESLSSTMAYTQVLDDERTAAIAGLDFAA